MSKVIHLLSKPVPVFGTARYSPFELSVTLKDLRVSHTYKVRASVPNRVCVEKMVNCGYPQPHWVHVTDSLDFLKEGAVNFISAAFSELALTNIPSLSVLSLEKAIKDALANDAKQSVLPQVEELSPMDYVNIVAKPSLLNCIQTTVYKINPYALRKEIQEMILNFLNSRVSIAQMKNTLKGNLKLEQLIPMIMEALPLRDAVARLKTESLEAVSLDTGFPTFELLYISKVRKLEKGK